MTTLGLSSDYTEYNREHKDIDPCMFGDVRQKNNYNNYYYSNTISKAKQSQYHYTQTIKETFHIERDTVSEYEETLEDLRKTYIQCEFFKLRCQEQEKIVIEIQRKYNLESPLLVQFTKKMLDNIDNARKSNGDMMINISSVLSIDENTINEELFVDTAEEKRRILEIMMTATNTVLQDEKCNYDVSKFRVLITDCGKLIKALDSDYNTIRLSKIVAQKYYREHFYLKYGTAHCVYCHHPMFEEIPYCFNCFERN